MFEENMTAEGIYKIVSAPTVTKEMAIRLIENYGIRQTRKELIEMQENFGGYTDEIEKAINRMNEKLDEMLREILREGIIGEVLS